MISNKEQRLYIFIYFRLFKFCEDIWSIEGWEKNFYFNLDM